MKVSAFSIITNVTKFGYPYIESIKSWLPVADELVIIDGGSTDGSIEEIEKIGDKKIRIVSDSETKWEDDWSYWRMGKNFSRGYHECVGDIIIKFDIDYVLHEDAYLKQDKENNMRIQFQRAIDDNQLIISFNRFNFAILDRYYIKSEKTLAVNRDACKRRNIPVDYGLDPKRWAWGYEPIVANEEKNKIKTGTLLRTSGNTMIFSKIKVFNYGFCFSTKEQVAWARQRHLLAEVRQKSLGSNIDVEYNLEKLKTNKTIGLRNHIRDVKGYLENRHCTKLIIEEHPKVMWDLIRNLKPEQQGYNLWNKFAKAIYYVKS